MMDIDKDNLKCSNLTANWSQRSRKYQAFEAVRFIALGSFHGGRTTFSEENGLANFFAAANNYNNYSVLLL